MEETTPHSSRYLDMFTVIVVGFCMSLACASIATRSFRTIPLGVYVCMYVCMYVCECVYRFKYTHTHALNSQYRCVESTV